MGLKVKHFPSLFKVPSCTQQPKTSSFRLTTSMKDDIFKTINSVYFDQESDLVETPDSWFTNSTELNRLSTSDESSMSICGDTHLESIVRGAQQLSSTNHRLFFDPTIEDSPKLGPTPGRMVLEGSDVCSIKSNTTIQSYFQDDLGSANVIHNVGNNKNSDNNSPFKESVAMSMDSEDPYEDFKRSMEEMMESLEVRDDWKELEELLEWYLKVNGRKYHGYIISAFIDLLVGVFGDNSSCDESSSVINSGSTNEIVATTSFCSATSSLISSCSSISDDMSSYT